MRILLAWLHLLAMGIGLAAVYARARALRDSLREPENAGALRRVYTSDAWWGVAAIISLVTGLWRLIGSTEKSTSYYMANHLFYAKMGVFVAILALEVWPMRTLVRWRSSKLPPDPRNAGRIEIISYVQTALVALLVLFAVRVARGEGASSTGAGAGGRPSVIDAAKPAFGSVSSPGLDGSGADEPIPLEPSGTETVTADDVVLLTREIAMPLATVSPSALRSNFNERRGGGARMHEALDIMAPQRTPVVSAASGRVLKLFTSRAGGLMVYAADSSERFVLLYAHLDGYAPGLHDGSAVAKGQTIGFVGYTGNAQKNAPHLHFAIARSADVKRWSRGKPIDPLPILQAASVR